MVANELAVGVRCRLWNTKLQQPMKTIEKLRSLGFTEKAIKHIIKNSIENWIFSYEL